ncbi:MAG TPA: PSD1 and planctomycete cytochrome C domain-containing protein [Pirellulales bacterium]|nr:PSD1 and planctomycete cytochrome C domain-containing protein [Pirellulales bacterium]
MRWILPFSTLCVTVSLASLLTAAEPQKAIDFSHEIAPLIKTHCGKCHTNGKSEGSLSLDTREKLLRSKAVVPGRAADSELIKRLTSGDPDERMPAKAPPLAVKEIELFRAWIDQGLAWEEGFSFSSGADRYVPPLKLRRVELPPEREGASHPIDRIVAAYLDEHKLAWPPELDDAGFARRASLDVTGLLPAPGERAAFLAVGFSDKRQQFVRGLLDDRRAYADHWLTFWNDLLRNDYRGTGYIDGGRKQISKWLYQALVDNKPYDQFVRELISPNEDSEGFSFGIKWRGRTNASQVPEIQFSQNVSLVFFGINMKCASCHDSFIDDWKLDDAYGLAAIVADRPLEIYRCDKATGRMASPHFLWPELGQIDPSLPKAGRLEQLAGLVTDVNNGRFTRTIVNRLWHRLMGRGLVHPVDVMANRPWSEDLLDYLATYLVEQHYDLKKLLEHILTSRTYQSRCAVVESESGGDDYVFRGPQSKRMTAEQFMDAVWQVTGTAPDKPVALVPLPSFPAETPHERQFVRASLVFCDELMRSLGRPNREQVVTVRGDVLTTLQALDLSNGSVLAEMLQRGAANVLKDKSAADAKEIVNYVYSQALSRPPMPDELATATELVGSPATPDGVADLLWAVFMLPEFQLIR